MEPLLNEDAIYILSQEKHRWRENSYEIEKICPKFAISKILRTSSLT